MALPPRLWGPRAHEQRVGRLVAALDALRVASAISAARGGGIGTLSEAQSLPDVYFDLAFLGVIELKDAGRHGDVTLEITEDGWLMLPFHGEA